MYGFLLTLSSEVYEFKVIYKLLKFCGIIILPAENLSAHV